MLVLTRRPGQEIQIADCITLRIIEIRGNHVVISFDAPKDIPIMRREVADKLKEEFQ